MRLAGHLHRHPELTASNLLDFYFYYVYGNLSMAQGVGVDQLRALTYVDSIRQDTGLSDTGEVGGLRLMADRLLWTAETSHQSSDTEAAKTHNA